MSQAQKGKPLPGKPNEGEIVGRTQVQVVLSHLKILK